MDMNRMFRNVFVVLVILGFAWHGAGLADAPAIHPSVAHPSHPPLASAMPFNGWLATGSTGYARAVSSLEINLPGDSSFTVEGWFKLSPVWDNSQPASVTIFQTEDGYGLSFEKECTYTIPVTCRSVIYKLFDNSGVGHDVSSIKSGWNHVALVNNLSTGQIVIYLNGWKMTTFSGTFSLAGGTDLLIGWCSSANCGGRPLAADEIRISDGARYTAGFTPSASPFTCDTSTLALWHFDELEGSTTFHDSCGTEDNGLMGVNDAHTEGVLGSWIFLPLVVRGE